MTVRWAAGVTVVVALAGTVARDRVSPPFKQLGFTSRALAFARAPRGAVESFPINPSPPWTMTLRKQ